MATKTRARGRPKKKQPTKRGIQIVRELADQFGVTQGLVDLIRAHRANREEHKKYSDFARACRKAGYTTHGVPIEREGKSVAELADGNRSRTLQLIEEMQRRSRRRKS